MPEIDILASADDFRFFSKYDLKVKNRYAVHVSSIKHILKLYINNQQKDEKFPSHNKKVISDSICHFYTMIPKVIQHGGKLTFADIRH